MPHVQWAGADLEDPAAVSEILSGASALFVLTSVDPAMARVQISLIDAAEAAGVERVVKLSAFGASSRSTAQLARWHHEVESHLKSSAVDWTLLRPHYFTQNLLAHGHTVATEGTLYSASGEGRIPFVDARDIAACASVTLTHAGHAGRTYTLTGAVALSFEQVAQALSGVLNRRVDYVAEPPDVHRARLIEGGVPDWLADDYLAIAAYHRAGGATATITRAVADLTGSPPRTVSDFLYERARDFEIA